MHLETVLQRDAQDPLAHFRQRFVIPEGVIYLDGNSLGALPAAAPAQLSHTVAHEWGQRLIRSWNEAGWIDLPQRLGARIAALIAQWRPARLVVGIPRHPDGASHEMTQRCERFARQLEGRHRLPVARVDERYSSAVIEGGRDDEAAAVILQQYLNQR